MNMELKKGSFIEFDGLLGVVTGSEGDRGVPEGHVAVWFGNPQGKRKSEGGHGGLAPEVWTVPIEYCERAEPPVIEH